MKSRDFVYWLQGYFEIMNDPPGVVGALSGKQVEIIKRHLAMVFKHEIDPSAGSTAHQVELNELHGKPQIGGIDPITGATMRC